MSGTTAALAALLASIFSLCFGTSFAKMLFPITGAMGITALRIGMATLLLVVMQRPWRWRLSRAGWFAVARYGLVLGCMNLTFYLALRTLPLGIAIAIEFLGPLGVAIFYSARRLDLLWVALAAAGVALLVLPGSGIHALDPTGVILAMIAAVCWAGYILFGKRATELVAEGRSVCLGLCFASLVAVPLGIFEAGPVLFTPDVLWKGAVVAITSSALPYSLEMFALKRLPRHVFGVALSLEPAVGALAALVMLGEMLTALQWVAILAVMIASCGSALGQPAAAPEPAPV